jgi:hypothetical protein
MSYTAMLLYLDAYSMQENRFGSPIAAVAGRTV